MWAGRKTRRSVALVMILAMATAMLIIMSAAAPTGDASADDETTGATIEIVDGLASDFPTSVALRPNGYPVIAYTSADLNVMVAICSDATCTSASTVVIDEQAWSPSLVINDDGNPVVAYLADISTEAVERTQLRVTQCLDSTCATTAMTVLDKPPQGFYFHSVPSLQLAPNGAPIVQYARSWHNANYADVKLARCSNAACTRVIRDSIGTDALVVPPMDSGGSNDSFALSDSGRIVFAYSLIDADNFDGGLEVVTCFLPLCDFPASFSHMLSRPDDGPASLKVARSGLPVVAVASSTNVADSGLVVRCHDAHCGDDYTVTPLVTGHGARTPKLALDRADIAVMALWHPESDASPLVVSRCQDLHCGSINHQLIVTGARHPSLVLDDHDYPVVSFLDDSSGSPQLALLRCTDRFCDPTVIDDYPSSGTYLLQNERRGRYLDVDKNGTVGTSKRPKEDDEWTLEPAPAELDAGFFTFESWFDTYLDADASGALNQSIRQSDDDVWRLVPAGDGSFYITNLVHPGWLSVTDDNEMALAFDESANERWRLVPVPAD